MQPLATNDATRHQKQDLNEEDNGNGTDELTDVQEQEQRLQQECVAMISMIRQLERQELEFLQQTKILAREALLCGYQPHLLETPAPKRRQRLPLKKE